MAEAVQVLHDDHVSAGWQHNYHDCKHRLMNTVGVGILHEYSYDQITPCRYYLCVEFKFSLTELVF